ncbi:HdeD family acid-resistance protein [Sorangium atrum]|uniref:HdeD family acid-resistance protein n=1 Tax=Sorangium atrum TaxID=2995308 RepID=A0ABT5CKX5_9BACT|nr:HdeD family acid-resistance protein [Sorangium aterium]MDC0685732.1 HdeD family acid-resistance protein [Sorangium aterium]
MADRWEDPVHTTSFGLQLVEPHTLRENRGSFIGLGIALLVLGALAILMPVIASLVTAVAIGGVLVASGLFQGVHAVQHRRWANSAWSLAGALIQLAAGVLIVAFPVTGTVTLTLILAAFFFAEGFLKIVRALQHREMPSWGWLLFDGLLALALGVLIWWRWPSTAAWAIGLLVGVNVLVSGMSMLLIGSSARQRPVASM